MRISSALKNIAKDIVDQQLQNQYAWQINEESCSYLDDITAQLKEGTSQEKSIAKILELMKKGSKIKQDKDNNNLLIVLGVTGTCKTTFSAYISGLNLSVISEEFGGEVEPKLQYSDMKNQMFGAIGLSDTESETLQPNFFKLDNETIIVDCPGLLDSRGVEVDISNSYCLNKAICYSQNIKFLIVLDGQSFQYQTPEKGKSLKDILEATFFLAQSTSMDFSKNIAIVFTRTQENEAFYREKFDNLINQLMESSDFNYQNLKYCDKNKIQKYLLQLLKAKIILFPLPQKQEIDKEFSQFHLESICQKIKEIQYYKKQKSENFHFYMTNQSLEILSNIRDCSRQIVKKLFEEICEYLSNFFINLNENQLDQFPQIVDNYNYQYETNKNKLNNITYYDLLLQYLFQPIINLQLNQYDQSYTKTLKKLQFFLREVYDNLLVQFNFLQDKEGYKINFGVIDCYEMSEGILLLHKSYERQKIIMKQQRQQRELDNQIMIDENEQNVLNQIIQSSEKQIDQKKKQINQLNNEANQLNMEEKIKQEQLLIQQQQEEEQKQILDSIQFANTQKQNQLNNIEQNLKNGQKDLRKMEEEVDRKIQEVRNQNENRRKLERQLIEAQAKKSSPRVLGTIGSTVKYGVIGSCFGPVGALVGGLFGLFSPKRGCSIF
ncbi:transmembrane protein, putative (macronuclear) [Tetrahymena thermophila SB210]|uniref:Transmembrane protein, putative n=1 Tax=Tetrahymena thermophila (strain SB210) TaxID=312017 RepID=Q23QG6_TETTS|nr:transmembrane protein, putative [Tetrahymena thermophila SB210]EAR98922.2 transmembrane protein, putative [Tetrahymena thermophila SB210]|eukprot:XP_001019167.2 transmembrane protein, putative [Tetrahymena thermophila SB210]